MLLRALPHAQHEDTTQDSHGDSRLESGLYPLGPGQPVKALGMGVVRSETSLENCFWGSVCGGGDQPGSWETSLNRLAIIPQMWRDEDASQLGKQRWRKEKKGCMGGSKKPRRLPHCYGGAREGGQGEARHHLGVRGSRKCFKAKDSLA